jgi:methyltransferase-like protein
MTENSYDVVPYPSTVFRATNADNLAMLGLLVGLKAALPSKCRYIELGCSDGGNIIPMAYAYPGSEFVGVDLSAHEIENGNRAIAQIGLKNVTLHQLDITAISDQFGKFDYIATHGVFSWVPHAVQEKIFNICQSLLNPHGMAYISYNTFPGWHMRRQVRDMMLYRVRKQPEPQARIKEARGFLDFLVEKVGTPEIATLTATDPNAYAASLRFEQNLLRQYVDSYFFHEHLEEVNEPLYFYEFMERARAHGLQYVSEGDFVSAQIANYPQVIAEAVKGMAGDIIEIQQYLDFLCNRTFRQTILCRADAALSRSATVADLSKFYFSSPIRPAAESIDLSTSAEEAFATHVNRTVTAANPIIKAALTHLGSIWPNTITFESLLATAHEMVTPGAPHVYTAERVQEEKNALGMIILSCFSQGIIEFHSVPTPFVTTISSFPVASAAARYVSLTNPTVPNMRHEQVLLGDIERQLITFLDGEHDHAALFNALSERVAEGVIVIQAPDGGAVETDEERNRLLLEAFNLAMQRLAGAALLVG